MVHVEFPGDTVVVIGELLSEPACARFGRALDTLRESASDPVGPTTRLRAIGASAGGALSEPRDIPTVDLSRVSLIAQESIDLLCGLWLDLFRQGGLLHLLAPDHVWNMLGEAVVNQALGRETVTAPAETGHPDGKRSGGTLWQSSR